MALPWMTASPVQLSASTSMMRWQPLCVPVLVLQPPSAMLMPAESAAALLVLQLEAQAARLLQARQSAVVAPQAQFAGVVLLQHPAV